MARCGGRGQSRVSAGDADRRRPPRHLVRVDRDWQRQSLLRPLLGRQGNSAKLRGVVLAAHGLPFCTIHPESP